MLLIPVALGAGLPDGVHRDLQPLGAIIGAAEVVGIGEEIHLSGGLEQARGELLLYAVETLGFRRIGVEISWVEGREVDAQLQACRQGSLLSISFADPLWEGLQEPLRQLCVWNRAHPDDPVRFFGIDVQDAWNHRAMLEFALGRGEDADLRRCHGAWVDSARELREWGAANGYPPPSVAGNAACLRQLRRLARRLSGDPDLLLAIASLQATQETNWLLLSERDVGAAYNAREAAMLEVFHQEQSRLGNGRTALLAHDKHIGRDTEEYTSIGARLTRALGDGYCAVAVGGDRVASRLGGGMLAPAPEPGSLETEWAALQEAWLLIERREDNAGHDAQIYLSESPAALR